MPPPNISPDTILETAPKTNRILKVDANVIAYFGDFFLSVERGLRVSAAPLKPAHTAPKYTASSQNRS
jgi:hypothetical protein